jgi:hypothetical protein
MRNAHRWNVMTSVLKMAVFTLQQKGKCIWNAELKLSIVQRRFWQEYGQKPLKRHT